MLLLMSWKYARETKRQPYKDIRHIISQSKTLEII